MRLALLLVLTLAVAAPLAAQDDSGLRFEIAPSGAGVTRVDTRTGTVSHCSQNGAVWVCEAVAGPSPARAGRASTSASIRNLAARMVERLLVVVHWLKHPHRAKPSTAAVS
jgi:hypothetical protein